MVDLQKFLEEPQWMASAESRRLVGLRLKAARMALGYTERRGKTQAAFYRMFCTCGSKERGNNWERGIAFPGPEFLIEFAEKFDIGPDWILLGRRGSLPDRYANDIVNNFIKIGSE
jgi:transcriptional regulator with XRE-family HTH domain